MDETPKQSRPMALLAILSLLGLVSFASGLVETQSEPETFSFVGGAATASQFSEHFIAENRSPDVPVLPFEDNPDPTLCGIPMPWDGQRFAWLSGVYGGEMIQPVVFVYDSHLRLEIAGEAPHGTPVEVLMFQSNPVLDYYLVDLPGALPRGWVPAELLSFEEVGPGT